MNSPIIILLRPHQWLKNVFVFVPLFFDRHATDWHYVWPSLLACLAFCMAASGIYCFNDIRDVEADRLHPVKCLRPIASGAVGKCVAYGVMGALWASALALTALMSLFRVSGCKGLAGTLLLYVGMNVAYCIKLKQIAILDVFIIAMGFVLRIVAGGLATGIVLSHWVVLTTFLLALFLALAKRRDDVAIYEASGLRVRKNVESYRSSSDDASPGKSMDFLTSAISMLGGITMMCYILYTVSDEVIERMGCRYLFATSVFVLAGLLRFLQLTLVDQKSGSPTTVLLHDRFLQVCIVGWLAAFAIILYQ